MKKAIALIELIFAIVVIGITLISVPNLIATTTKGTKNAITQEAISNGVSFMNMILSSFWDENSITQTGDNPILYVQDGSPSLNEALDSNNNPLGQRVGSAKSTSRRFGHDLNGNKIFATPTSNFGLDGTETTPDDIDDYNNYTTTIQASSDPGDVKIGDYKDKTIALTVQVNYISDKVNYNNQSLFFNPFNQPIQSQSSNIKLITLTVSSTKDPQKRIILRGFSCNIGSSKLKEKLF